MSYTTQPPATLIPSLPYAPNLQPLLQAVVEEVRPTQSELEEAQRRGEKVGQVLQNDGYCESFLIGGSVVKGTALSPVKDVDVFVLLDEPEWMSTLGKLYHPRTILARFDERLRQTYGHLEMKGHATIRRQRRSVSVRFTNEYTVNIDVVPVLRDKGSKLRVLERWEGDWTPTHPERQIKVLGRHDTSKEPVRDALRLLKLWRRTNRVELPSCALEVLVLLMRKHKAPPASGALFELVMGYIAETGLRQPVDVQEHGVEKRGTVTILDPAVAGLNVTSEMTAAERDVVVDAAKAARNRLAEMREIVARGTTWGLKGPLNATFGVVPSVL